MKSILSSLVLLIIVASCENYKKVSDVVYDKYSEQSGFSMIVLPPNFVDKFVSEDQQDEKKFLMQLRDLRLMIFDDEVDGKPNQSIYEDVNKLLSKRGFEEFLSLNKSGSKVTIKAKEKDGIIKEMHVLVKGEDKFFMASLQGRIDANTIGKTMNAINFDDFGEIESFSKDFDWDDFTFDFAP